MGFTGVDKAPRYGGHLVHACRYDGGRRRCSRLSRPFPTPCSFFFFSLLPMGLLGPSGAPWLSPLLGLASDDQCQYLRLLVSCLVVHAYELHSRFEQSLRMEIGRDPPTGEFTGRGFAIAARPEVMMIFPPHA